MISDPENTVFVSAVSLWEVWLKQSPGKLRLPPDFEERLARESFESLPLTAAHAREVALLPWRHRDPFDRMLVAQPRAAHRKLLTADEVAAAYGISRTGSAQPADAERAGFAGGEPGLRTMVIAEGRMAAAQLNRPAWGEDDQTRSGLCYIRVMVVRNISQAKAELSALIQEVMKGNEVILAKAGKPVARLVAYQGPRQPRKPGSMAGELWIAPDFDVLPDDTAEAFGIKAPSL